MTEKKKIHLSVTGWHEGAMKVSATLAIRERGTSLKVAKKVVDDTLNKGRGEAEIFTDEPDAEKLVRILWNMGWEAQIQDVKTTSDT